MISIISKVFSRSNVTNVNQRIINEDKTVKHQKFDERKSEDAHNVEKITIDSTMFDVNVSVSDSSKVEAHLYGQANVDGFINFDVLMVNRELRITLKFTGNYCYNSSLKLDVTVPKKTFKAITANSSSADITFGQNISTNSLKIKTQSGNITLEENISTNFLEINTKSGDITLEENVSTNSLKIKTQSGNLETNTTFVNASISTMSGDVELCIYATEDISVDISTMSGDVSANFNNINYIDLSTSSKSGDVSNRHKSRTGYTANVKISTMSGDIRVN